MSMNEFALIKRYFEGWQAADSDGGADDVVVGIGDDCAVLNIDASEELLISTDTLLAGVHFPVGSDPRLIAQRALRVNLSDLAAMGARARWFLLALTLPESDENWLQGFSRGLREVSEAYNCPLVGGDTTRGPLSITVSALGSSPRSRALLRSTAQADDAIYVTGFLGDGAAGLALLETGIAGKGLAARQLEYLQERFWRPSPRLSEGLILRDYASAAIDISDGLLADLGHIMAASGLGAEVKLGAIPLSEPLLAAMTKEEAISLALRGGDDYELCFTVPKERVAMFETKLGEGLMKAHCIGQLSLHQGLRCRDASGRVLEFPDTGYRHF